MYSTLVHELTSFPSSPLDSRLLMVFIVTFFYICLVVFQAFMLKTKTYLCPEVSPRGLLKSWLCLSNVSYLNLGHQLHLVFKNISKQDFDEEQVRVNFFSVCFT